MIRGPKIELYSNERVDKVFFIIKSFITFYLILLDSLHKNVFHDGFFLSAYSILQMELHFSGLVKNHNKISLLGCLESAANKKGVYLG